MKYVLFFLLLLTSVFSAAADWLVGAEYRLEIRRDDAEHITAIDLRRLLLPVPLTNGVVVTNQQQEPVNFYLDSRQCLFMPPLPAGKYYIYFGFPRKTMADRWDRKKHGDLPPNRMLTVRLLHAWGLFASEAEWMDKKTEWVNRRYIRSQEWHQKSLYWQGLANAAPGLFTKYSSEIWLQLNFYRTLKVQMERFTRFQSLASKAQTWRFRRNPRHRRPPVFRGSSGLPVWIPSLQRYNTIYRPRSTMIGLRRTAERWRDELAKLKTDVHGAPERELQAQFSKPNIRVFGQDIAREINLPKRAFDAGGVFACSYTGAMHVPAAGEYEFGITSNSMTILKLGDECITVRSGKSAPDEVKTVSIKRQLKPGLHDFALYYLKTQVTTHLTMTWKKPGDKGHAILTDLDFRPAIPLPPTALTSRDGGMYPVVEREDRQDFFYGKLHKAEFAGFTVLAPENLPFEWEVNGETYPAKCSRLLLTENPPVQARLLPRDSRYRPLPVSTSTPTGTRLAVDSGLWIHTDLPMTLKHDEVLNGYRELRSRLPIAVTARLRTRVTGSSGTVFRNEDKFVKLDGKLPEELDRFAEDKTYRTVLPLKGPELVRGIRVEWETGLPGLTLDRMALHFLPVTKLPADLKPAAEGFVNGSNERVIPVLQRPSLHQLRKGESWKALRRALSANRKILIITDAPGSERHFPALLKTICRKAGLEAEVHCWKNTAHLSGSRTLDSVPDLLRAIQGSPAETVLFIPAMPSLDRTLPDREKLRMTALLLEKIRTLPQLRRLILATPFPAFSETDRQESPAFDRQLQTLAREYGAQWMDWEKTVLARMPEYTQAFQNTASGVLSNLPDQQAEALAQLLIQELQTLL